MIPFYPIPQAQSVGSQSVTRYSSHIFNFCIPSSSISKLSTSAFATIRSLFTLFGNGTYPCCRLHLTSNCAGEHPYFLLSSTTTGCFMRIARARGAYASTMIPLEAQKEVISVRVLKGWTSTWLTAGTSFGFASRSSCNCARGLSTTTPAPTQGFLARTIRSGRTR